MKQYFLDRLKEPSTWRGIILVLTATGITINPQWQEAITTLGLALAGSTAIVTKG